MKAFNKLRKTMRIAINICCFILGMCAASAIIFHEERIGTGGGELLIPLLGVLLILFGWEWRGLIDSSKK